jgi:excisionase family DNA binding protein
MEGDMVTVTEAAQMLGTTKEKIARLVKQGVLTVRPSIVDGRRRLIPRAQIERILREEGRPIPLDSNSNGLIPGSRPWPRTIGMYTGPVPVEADQVDEYLRAHWHPD